MAKLNKQQNQLDIFAPPTEEEMRLLSGPTSEGEPIDAFAPPTAEEEATLFAPPTAEELSSIGGQVADIEPTGLDKMLTDEDLKRIGSKYGVDPEKLRDLSPLWDTQVVPRFGAKDIAKQVISPSVGLLGRGVLLNVPQKLYQKSQPENVQKAIDELSRIGSAQKSGFEKAANLAAEIALPGGAIASGAKSLGARLAGAAATGAVAGGAGAETGQELKGAAIGSAIGLGLGAGASAAGRGLEKLATNANEPKVSKQFQLDLGKAEEETLQKLAASEKEMQTNILTPVAKPVTYEQAKIIISEQKSPQFLKELEEQEAKNRANNLATIEQSQISGKALPSLEDESLVVSEAQKLIDKRLKDFVKHINDSSPSRADEARGVLEDIASRQGKEAVQNSYEEYTKFLAAKKAIEEQGLLAKQEQGFFGNALDFMSDAQFVAKGIDQRFRTDVEGIHSDINKAVNLATEPSKKYRERLESLFNQARKLGTDKSVVNTDRVYKALDAGDITKLTPEEKQTAEQFAKYFADVRQEANTKTGNIAPLNIPELRNTQGNIAYVPKRLVEHTELVKRLDKELAEAQKNIDISKVSNEELNKVALENDSFNNLINAATLLDNKPIQNGQDLLNRIRKMTQTRDGFIALQTQAKAAMERTGALDNVDFLLEKNLYKLAQDYADNTIKHKYLRRPLEQLGFQEKRLRALGADTEADYVRKLNEDIMGIRKGTMAEATARIGKEYLSRIDEKLEKTRNPVTKGVLLAAKAAPTVVQELTRQIYPNVLGYGSVRAVLQNLTQPLTKVAPELGTVYGKELVGRAATNLVGNWKKTLARVEATGQIPAEFTKAGERAIAEGILRNSLYRIPKDIVDGMGKAGMAMFTKGEQLNRALTWGVGEALARDLAAGNPSAIKAISEMSPYVGNRLKKLDPVRDKEKVEELLGGYLNDKTMYNYNRASMSEFGRTMGPFFSTFSKWPTATLGDVVQVFRDRGALESLTPVARRYLEPLLLLQAVDTMLGERNATTESIGLEGDGLTDRQKKIMGSQGFSQSAPLGSLGAIARGEIFTPPALDAVFQTAINPFLNKRNEGLEDVGEDIAKGMGSSVINFVPGSGLFRFLFEDLPTYATGERPEGTTSLDRIIEGMRKAGQ